MHSSKKGKQWYFGMKAHIGADADSGLLHTVRGTSGHVSDIAEANTLLHGQESVAFGDAGYQGVDKRPDARTDVTWHVVKRQFGFVKMRYRGLKKNTAQLVTLFALSNLWMVRRQLMGAQA